VKKVSGNTPFPVEWYKAIGVTKLACYNTYRKFRIAATEKFGQDLPVKIINDDILNALIAAVKEVTIGNHFDHFIIPAIQGGAGASINMNINEIITNSALLNTGQKCGEYSFIDPLEHANIYQSTNDVIPTALTVAVMKLLQLLEEQINILRQKVGEKTISIPARQVGSSIMPGKINPVIPEFVISAAHKIYSNDILINSLSGQGTLELNAYLPVIGCAVIESINLLISCDSTLLQNLFAGLTINEASGYKALINSSSITTALSPYIGYHKVAEIASLMKEKRINIFEANGILKVINDTKLKTIL